MKISNESPRSARMRWIALLLAVVFLCPATWAFAGSDPEAAPVSQERLRVERTTLAGGAEILTIFGSQTAGTGTPIVAILNDTLGDEDPANWTS